MHSDTTLIETVCIRNGRVQRIAFHNERCNHSRKSLLGIDEKLDLRKYIDTSQVLSPWTKCRITYNSKIQNVEYEPYTIKPIESLRLVHIGDYEYPHKFKQRDVLDSYFRMRQDSDDIIMVKDGMLTDSYYANIALQKDGIWHTPTTPLLKGTRRAYLLAKNKIVERDIHQEEIKEYSCITLFNAMIPLGSIEVSVDKIN